jgi:hypothetical protein
VQNLTIFFENLNINQDEECLFSGKAKRGATPDYLKKKTHHTPQR